jgi:hypothetical protein
LSYNVQNALVFHTGRLYLNSHIRTPDLIGIPIHALDHEGEIIRSFGLRDSTASFTRNTAWPGWRRMTLSMTHSILTSYLNRLLLEEWTVDGRFVRAFETVSHWFTPYDEFRPIRPNTELQPSVAGIQATANSQVVRVTTIGAANWRNQLQEVESLADGMRYQPTNGVALLYDSVIELLDLDTGTVVAIERFDHYLSGWVSGATGLMFSPDRNASGEPVIRVFRLNYLTGGSEQ